MSDLTILDVKYHRNGVIGAGFFLVQFTADDDEGYPCRLVACVFPEFDPETEEIVGVLKHGGTWLISVVDIDNPSEHWRADEFAAELLPAIQAADLSREAYR